MEYIKKHTKKIVGGLVSATVVLFVIPRIIAWMHSFTIIKTDTSNDWLSFWGGYLGALIGAAVTIIVFRWTLQENEKVRRQEQRLQVIPVLNYKVSDVEIKENIRTHEQIFNDIPFNPDSRRLCFSLHIQNIGLGAAQEFCFDYWDINNIKINTVETHEKENLNIMLPNKEVVVSFVLDFPPESRYDQAIGQEEIFSRRVYYKNIFGEKYYQDIKFRFTYIMHSEGIILEVKVIDFKPAELCTQVDKTRDRKQIKHSIQ